MVVLSATSNSMTHNFKTLQESETCTHKVQHPLEMVTIPSVDLMVVLSATSNSMTHNFKTSQELDLS
jgi:hypothetical protein